MTVKKIVQNLSKTIGIDKKIYLASTGVIGEPLDPNKIIKKIPYLLKNLSNNSKSWLKAANAIRTTDTFPKVYSDKLTVDNSKIFINGIAKGSGMIAPNMATMLSLSLPMQSLVKEFKTKFFKIVEKTFNSITVDNDTSTSDMVLLIFVKNKINPKLELNKKEFFYKT